MLRSLFISLLLVYLIPVSAYSVDIGDITHPIVVSFDRSDYNGASQNWSITQDDDNIMWFGNIGKVLWFDGTEWGSVSIPNTSIVRSLYKNTDNSILLGAFAEFGSIEKDTYGNYIYTSWTSKIPEEFREFTDVWKIHELNNIIYVQTYEYIFAFHNNEYLGVFKADEQFMFSFVSNGRLYAEDLGSGLKVMLDNELLSFEKGDFFIGKSIWFLNHAAGKLIVGTQSHGIFVFQNGTWNEWNASLNKELKEHILFCGLQMDKTHFLLGTVKNGILIVDEKGNIEKRIMQENGLQNNTVLSAFMDDEKNVWLGLDKGIDYLKLKFQFSTLSNTRSIGTGYASVLFNDQIYLGTNQGAFTWSEEMKDFKIIENTAGQVWSFEIIEDKLYCCHNNGIYQINGSKADLVAQIGGTWKLIKMPGKEGTYISGNYTGMHALVFGNQIQYWPIKGFTESCRIMEFDESNELWMSHGYKGVYKISFSDDLTSVDSYSYFGINQGLPSNTSNEVFKYNDQILIASIDGFYHYNSLIGLMEPHTQWNEMLPLEHPVSKVFVDKWNRISFFDGGKISWAFLENDSLTYFDANSFLPLNNQLFNAFENIYYLSENIAIIGTVEGFLIYNREIQFAQNSDVKLNLVRAYCLQGKGASILRTDLEIDKRKYRIPNKFNTIYFEVAAPEFQNHEFIEINYSIDHQQMKLPPEENMIVVQDLKGFNNLIKIIAIDKARNISSPPIEINVSILPPWYLRWYSYMVYAILLFCIFLILVRYMRRYSERIRRMEQRNQSEKIKQQQELLRMQAEEAEKEIMKMRNEKLAIENRIKAEEIANSTMELVHKNKMLLDVKDTLKFIQKETSIDRRNNTIKGILKKIDRDLDNEEKWIVFEKNFDEVHENFLNRLKEKHPSLTAKDLRLCAYLRMNLSSKEIAPLLRISIRSVEISRYRLRKKLELPRETNLSDYILLF